MAAFRAKKYETGVEALTEWKERSVEYLFPRASVLGAAILGCFGRNPDAEDWLQEGLEADSSYVNARLRQISLLSKETKPAAVVDASSRETLKTRLMTLLTASKPQRYPQLHSLSFSDFQAASRAIDLARDDDVSNALDTLGNVAGNGGGHDARICIEATIRLQMGEAEKAEALIASVAHSTPMPGSVWWNWAATASARDAYEECVARLLRCVTTEYSLKAEAWAALLVAAILASDLDAAKKAAVKCHLLSDRSRSLILSLLDGLPEAVIEAAGISAELANTRPQAEPGIDTEALKTALQQKNLRRAVEVLKKEVVTSVRDLPEYEAAPLEPDLITEVPLAVIQHDMQGDFRKGLALLLSGDPAGAEGIFRALSERVRYCWPISVNLACALYSAGNYSEALEILEDRYATSPGVWQAANATSVLTARVALKKFGEAHALLLKERTQLGKLRFFSSLQSRLGRDTKRAARSC
jgi:tetratricopeptide (TPR) repeat protein